MLSSRCYNNVMKVSFNQRWRKSSPVNGFGYARQMCEKSLKELGHTVRFNDETADVEINFIQPEFWVWSGVDYRIAYLPWESTKLKDGWAKALNEVDEVWTPSPIIAEWFRQDGVTKPVYVYEHGVENIWTNQKRTWNSEEFQVFHHGADAIRKGFKETMECYNSVFLDKIDSCMNFKMSMNGFNVNIPNTNILRDRLPVNALVDLYHKQHLMLYPSWGEGFGLTPLQAIATGLPTIMTKGWASYEYLIPESFLVSTELVESPWQHIHPGKMLKPDFDELVEKTQNVVDNYDAAAEEFYDIAWDAHNDFSWKEKTRQAFEHLL